MIKKAILCVVCTLLIVSCARMGRPDGGWYDETPPRVLYASPADKAVNVKTNKATIYFDEYIKLENPSEKVIVSPPQIEMPVIRAQGKSIRIELKDSLKKNTTYTVDFSDAISDNNEGNPMGNYTYSFSTGPNIDTLEVSGCVLQAEDLEPVKGILVGLYSDLSDSAFVKAPMQRVARTDSRGHFVIKGVAPGKYRINAINDGDGNYYYSQLGEMIAFTNDIVEPTLTDAVRQDTLWRDSLHIESIKQTTYTRFLPDNIILRAFEAKNTNRYFVKAERNEANHFTLFFSYGNKQLPQIKGMNFNEQNAFLVEPNVTNDTIRYWLRDTMLVNQDTLKMQMKYLMTDSAGHLVQNTDTMEILSKQPYEKRVKARERAMEAWKKKVEKAKKKGEDMPEEMPVKTFELAVQGYDNMSPMQNILMEMPVPLGVVDTSKIHLFAMHDSIWYRVPYELQWLESPRAKEGNLDSLPQHRYYRLLAEWKPGIEYSFETDSAAFIDMYGVPSRAWKNGFKVRSLEQCGTIVMLIPTLEGVNKGVQLLDKSGAVVDEVYGNGKTVEFFYLSPGEYYMRLYIDANGNRKWDTGDFYKDMEPEKVYYYPSAITCREKWDVTLNWNPMELPLNRQKPEVLVKQKGDQQKKITLRNYERAKKLGIEYVPKLR